MRRFLRYSCGALAAALVSGCALPYYWQAIDRKRLDWLARRLELEPDKMWTCVHDALLRIQAAWREHAHELPFSPAHRAALAEQWERVPVLREAGGLP